MMSGRIVTQTPGGYPPILCLEKSLIALEQGSNLVHPSDRTVTELTWSVAWRSGLSLWVCLSSLTRPSAGGLISRLASPSGLFGLVHLARDVGGR